jgi:ATP-dependent helicase/nuclease subunit A
VEWVLDLPSKVFYEHEPVLAAYVAEAEAEAGYESLSLLYVAMTRAKRAMYVLTKPPGKSVSRNFPRVLADTLGEDVGEITVGELRLPGTWASGDSTWFQAVTPEIRAEQVREVIEPVDAPAAPRHLARQPSGERGGVVEGPQLFAAEQNDAVQFGRDVHALLAGVEWGSEATMERQAAAMEKRGPAGAEAAACLRTVALRQVWERPAQGAEVWRERAFEVVMDGDWVTGVFDRVVVERDAEGRVRRATVLDFKTDEVAHERAMAEAILLHAGQINLYRRAVARLTGLREAEVGGELVFTRLRRRAILPPG